MNIMDPNKGGSGRRSSLQIWALGAVVVGAAWVYHTHVEPLAPIAAAKRCAVIAYWKIHGGLPQ